MESRGRADAESLRAISRGPLDRGLVLPAAVGCLALAPELQVSRTVRTHNVTLAEELKGIRIGGGVGEEEQTYFLFSAVLPGCPGKSPGNAAFQSFLSMLSLGLLS